MFAKKIQGGAVKRLQRVRKGVPMRSHVMGPGSVREAGISRDDIVALSGPSGGRRTVSHSGLRRV